MHAGHWVGGAFGFVLGVILVMAALEAIRRRTAVDPVGGLANIVAPLGAPAAPRA